MGHRSVPEAADRENLAIVVLRREVSEEFAYARSSFARIGLLHDAEEALWIRAVRWDLFHDENQQLIVNFKD